VSHGFGRFVRSLVGLDRAAVSEAFSEFLSAGTATAATDISPTGPEKLFDEENVTPSAGF
jgi:type I restriction enzyme, R subunit